MSDRWNASLMGNYGTPRLTLVRGEGATVWDEEGRAYVDLLAGIAVNALGHAHPRVVEAVSRQVATLGHTSNLYAHPVTMELAERLLALTGREGRVFFCNSGAEANEAAFKLSRLTGRTKVVAATGSFHGRTMGALALTGQPAKVAPFAPLPGEVVHVPYGDVPALQAAVDDDTAMVLLEPIQGEAGVVPPPAGYLQAAQDAARRHGALFALDEVQTGIARTGAMFAYQHDGLTPDVVTLAKGLGGGLPIGATIGFGAAGGLFTPGTHGTTFGGNPVSAAAALAVLDVVQEEDLAGRAKHLGEHLTGLLDGIPGVTGIRGAGLLRGVGLDGEHAKAAEAGLVDRGFLVNAVAPDVLRLAPPLVVSEDQLSAFASALPAVLEAARA